jgi:hypothetical protein
VLFANTNGLFDGSERHDRENWAKYFFLNNSAHALDVGDERRRIKRPLPPLGMQAQY